MKKRLLVIDDNPADAELVRVHLDRADVEHALTVSQGLAILRDGKPFDAVLLDMHLPDGQGPSLVSRVARAAPHVPIVVLSGSMSEPEAAAEALRVGAQDWIGKDHLDSVLLSRAIEYAIDRKSAQRRLAESDERFRQLADNTDTVFWVMSADLSRVLYLNPAFDRLFGTNRETVYDDVATYYTLVDPDDLPDLVHALERLARGDAPLDVRVRLVRPDNDRRTARVRGFTIRDVKGVVYRVAGTIEDVTMLTAAEERAAAAARRFESILGSAGEGIYGLDLHGNVTFANQIAGRLLDHPPHEMIGRHAHRAHHHTRPDGTPHPVEECPIYKVLRDGRPRRVEEDAFWTRSGKRIDVSYVATPLMAGDKLEGVVVVFADVSESRRAREESLRTQAELKAANERLQELQDFRLQLLNNIAHDMATPLTALQLRIEMIAHEPAREDGTRALTASAFASMESATRQLMLLTKDVRDVSLMEAGTFRLHLREVDALPLLRDALGTVGPLATTAGVNVEAVLPDEPLRVHGDPGRLTQAVNNLVTNAIKFSPRGGKITVGIARRDGHVHIDVQDEGPGIPHAARERLFRPFSQVHDDTDVKKGTGLGLYIVRGIMRAHGGDADLLPTERGAWFRLTMPVAKA